MEHIGTLIRRTLARRGLAGEAQAGLITHHAREWLAGTCPSLRDCAEGHTFKDGILVIRARHSAAAQELLALREPLLAYLRNDCQHGDLQSVRLIRSP